MSRAEIEAVQKTCEGLEQRLDRLSVQLQGAAGGRELALACAAAAEKIESARLMLRDTLDPDESAGFVP